ncbi:DUF6249 domain-containing protein [Occallatibacter riparius]|uniref:DUF6249 domain-containing protein n=1 Tax=Occallatibacter riparius TaxID=1002689 RepID=A0A9J7BS10_9BACT|nr:DUF6249 domain-containing protein [Occallatibacter riparius]UWZ85359.1 DUF6249 domain-containing protein [Occallatibacter riparius]
MEHMAMAFEGLPMDFGLWMFLSIGAVALFVVFIPLVSWIDSRRKEREAFYKADMMRRLAEASGDGAKAALELLREEERIKAIKQREGLKIGGLVNVAIGIGLSIMLYSIGGRDHGPYLVGLIPGLLGVALLVYVFAMAAPIEPR